jgi:hypothetical protein
MSTNILAIANALSDHDLIARLDVLATKEREASVQLVAHLAALDSRPAVYAALGFGSLFSYCTQALRLSEDAACNRIDAARACRRFPLILDLLASGALTLTSVRLLARHLTPENHEAVLARARHKGRREIEALVAELAPRPDVPSSVRRLPTLTVSSPVLPTASVAGLLSSQSLVTGTAPSSTGWASSVAPGTSAAVLPLARPMVQATAPQRYRIQLTIGQETHDTLRRLQALLRREVPDGDSAVIFDRALRLLLEKVEKAKLGAVKKPRQPVIRPAADSGAGNATSGLPSRHVPEGVKRAVWQRDGGRCAFVSATGRRCSETTFLELHHRYPYAMRGPATADNIALHCRRHNVFEAERIFGPYRVAAERKPWDGWDRSGIPARDGPGPVESDP